MKIETLSPRKPTTVKRGSLYHEIGSVTQTEAFKDPSSGFAGSLTVMYFITSHHFAKKMVLCLSLMSSFPDIPGLHFSLISLPIQIYWQTPESRVVRSITAKKKSAFIFLSNLH